MSKNRSAFIRVLSLVTIAFLLITVSVGCGSTADNGEKTQSTASVGTTATEGTTAEQDGPLTPYKDTVTISIPGVEYSNVKFIEGESIVNNFVSKLYEEKLNIKYETKWLVETGKDGEKLNLAIASNDLPDTFIADTSMIARLKKADQIQDVTEVYEKYASDNLRKVMEYQDKRGFLGGTIEGKYYGLPISNDFASFVSIVYIRADWMKKLNLSAPKTLDDLFTIAKAFTEQDPDGNGNNDTYGFGISKTWNYASTALPMFANPLKAYPNTWIKDGSGKLVFGSIQPEMKTALGKIQEAVSQKLIDPEFAVIDDNKVNEQMLQNKFGIYAAPFWAPVWPLSTTIKEGSEADWAAYPIPVNTDGKYVTQNSIFAYSWQVISKQCKNPEAIVKSMNLWYEVFHGSLSKWYNDLRATEKYKPVADGTHMYGLPVFFAEPEKNLKLGKNITQALEADNPDLLETAEGRMQWDVIKQGGPNGWGWKVSMTQSEATVLPQYEYVYNEFAGSPTKTMESKWTALTLLQNQTFMDIILGSPLSDFDEFVTKWNAMGGADITKEVNDWYEGIKK